MAAYRESSRRDLRVKKKLKSLKKKKRHGGIFDRKPFRITKLILSRKGQVIVKECYHFSISSATLSSPELRAGNRGCVAIRVSETAKVDRKFSVQRKFKVLTSPKWLMMDPTQVKRLMECERRKGLSNPILGEKWAGSGGREKVKRKLRIQQMKL